MAFVTDPGQGRIGVWQPGVHKGFGVLAEPGAPSWFELHTRAYDASVEFYRNGVRLGHARRERRRPSSATPRSVKAKARSRGSWTRRRSCPTAPRPRGTVYFGTDDTDKSLATIVDLGGAIVQPAEDTPYGRLATASDPTGAVFRLHKAS